MTVLSTQNYQGVKVVDWESESEEGEFEKGVMKFDEKVEQAAVQVSRWQLALIYSLHLAEAIVTASLQPQIYMLLQDEKICGSIDAVYWNGVIEAVFALGSVAGLFWGWVGDRLGRRPVALAGMVGMACSCFAMGFSTGLVSCALIRGFAGLMGSSMRVMVWTMLGDVSDTSKTKAKNFSRMPLVATGGIIGPLLQVVLANKFAESALWKRFPILSSQMACAALMVLFFGVNYFFLKETLPDFDSSSASDAGSQGPYIPRFSGSSEYLHEKDAFLAHRTPTSPTSSEPDLYTQYTYTYNDKPKPLSFSAAIRAPSLLILLASFTFLSLHSASFDQLLPILGSTSVSEGGLGLPCSFLSVVVLVASSAAAGIIYLLLSKAVGKVGVLQLYRLCCWLFPLIYVLTPILGSVARNSKVAIAISASSAIFGRMLVGGVAQILVVVLVTNASPDAYSMGSIMGLLHSASAIRGLAVFLSLGSTSLMNAAKEDVKGKGEALVIAANVTIWAVLGTVAVAGAVLAWFVKERAVVGRDWMVSALKWEICYESDESLVDEDEERGRLRRGSTSSNGSASSGEFMWGSEYGGSVEGESDAESVVV